MAQAELYIRSGAQQGRTVMIVGETFRIGRSSDCELRLQDGRLSRVHVAIQQEGGAFYLEDLNSKNGTALNQRPITTREQLYHSDLITVGDTELEFRLQKPVAFSFTPTPEPEATPTDETRIAYKPPPPIKLVRESNYTPRARPIGSLNAPPYIPRESSRLAPALLVIGFVVIVVVIIALVLFTR
ncbi:MAG: hypothetical protein GFH27_549367n60 [Chloroflexi bacterium AL-W]|nr:hypothetical protein [Chloroflexi bacterium AL-W]